MQLYTATPFESLPKIRADDDWMRKRQGLRLPIHSPSTQAAKQYWFTKIKQYAQAASQLGRSDIDKLAFVRDWNESADGIDRFYITVEIMEVTSKSWEKVNNIHASQELVANHLHVLDETRRVFKNGITFPGEIAQTDPLHLPTPTQGRLEDLPTPGPLPASISSQLSVSRPPAVAVVAKAMGLASETETR